MVIFRHFGAKMILVQPAAPSPTLIPLKMLFLTSCQLLKSYHPNLGPHIFPQARNWRVGLTDLCFFHYCAMYHNYFKRKDEPYTQLRNLRLKLLSHSHLGF